MWPGVNKHENSAKTQQNLHNINNNLINNTIIYSVVFEDINNV